MDIKGCSLLNFKSAKNGSLLIFNWQSEIPDLTLFFLKNYNVGSKLWQHIPHIIHILKNEKELMAFLRG
jgi:hypothetical protein